MNRVILLRAEEDVMWTTKTKGHAKGMSKNILVDNQVLKHANRFLYNQNKLINLWK